MSITIVEFLMKGFFALWSEHTRASSLIITISHGSI